MKKQQIKRCLGVSLSVMMMAGLLSACGGNAAGGTQSESEGQSAGTAQSETEIQPEMETDPAGGDESKSIVLIAKAYQNPYYQVLFQGAEDAGKEYGFTVSTNGPDAESNVPMQVDQVTAAVNQKPTAIGLAACDPAALQEILTTAKDNGVSVIGFDSGVPDDASGAVVATAATDNYNAGAVVAEKLFENEDFQDKLSTGTAENPVNVGILAQDTTSGSIVIRVNGFVDKLTQLMETVDGFEDCVEVSGQTIWNQAAAQKPKAILSITVPPTTTQADIQTAATSMLQTPNLIAAFPANLGTVDGFLSATSDGTDLDRETGKYKDLIVVGFDAGKGQKDAIAKGYFLGAGTQDPYTMGYETVRLAAEIAEGKTPSDVDTGTVWYTSENMDDAGISELLYD